jgi:hypothetical protein
VGQLFSKIMYVAMLGVLITVPAWADTVTETFPDPLGSYWSRWLYQNSNIGSYYYATGTSSDPDYRGNNPVGLWPVDTQQFNDPGNVGGPTMTIVFNDAYAALLTSLQFGMECFAQCQVSMYDLSNNVLASGVFSGGGFDFDHSSILSATSSNGIKKIVFDSTQYGGGQIEGNTSVDNFSGTIIPEPGTIGAFVVGLAALAVRRR